MITLVESVEDAHNFITWLGQRRSVLAIDTETGGFDVRRCDLRLVQFGDAEDAWVVPFQEWRGVVVEAMRRYDGPMVMHNSKFDTLFIEHHTGLRVPWKEMHDTRAMAHIIDPVSPTGLKPLGNRYIDNRISSAEAKLHEGMAKAGWDWSTVPVDFGPYWQYAGLDAIITAKLHDMLYAAITADPDLTRAYTLEMAATRVLADMEYRGAAVDVEFAQRKFDEFMDYVDQLKIWAKERWGCSLGSNAQVIAALQALGVELTKTTKSGKNLALDEEVLLEVIAAGSPEVGELATATLRARKVTKIASTYLDHFVRESIDGRVFCKINPLGAKTGRMSITDPALQTLPRASADNPAAITVRDCFVPSEGNRLVMCDFDQIELRLAAHFARDPVMMEVLANSDDPFTEFARRIYNDPELSKKDPRRQLTKNASYAKLYGAGTAKFSMTAGISPEEGRSFMAQFDAQFPGIRQFQDMVQSVARRREAETGDAWVSTPFGRRLKLDRGEGHYKLVNYLIQGTAADVLKLKLVELDQAGLGEYMILPVHDEVVFDVPADVAGEVGREAAHIMSEELLFEVALPVGADGPYDRWGDKYR